MNSFSGSFCGVQGLKIFFLVRRKVGGYTSFWEALEFFRLLSQDCFGGSYRSWFISSFIFWLSMKARSASSSLKDDFVVLAGCSIERCAGKRALKNHSQAAQEEFIFARLSAKGENSLASLAQTVRLYVRTPSQTNANLLRSTLGAVYPPLLLHFSRASASP